MNETLTKTYDSLEVLNKTEVFGQECINEPGSQASVFRHKKWFYGRILVALVPGITDVVNHNPYTEQTVRTCPWRRGWFIGGVVKKPIDLVFQR